MKRLTTILLVWMLGTGAAVAKLTPMDQLQFAGIDTASNSAETTSSTARNTMESNYFQAPQERPAATEKIFPCRFNIVFAKTRLAQTCN